MVRGNTISDHYWTGCSAKNAAQTGCTPWVSVGFLLIDVNPNDFDVSRNFYRNNQRNHWLFTSASLGS